jgi:hypothetical protein
MGDANPDRVNCNPSLCIAVAMFAQSNIVPVARRIAANRIRTSRLNVGTNLKDRKGAVQFLSGLVRQKVRKCQLKIAKTGPALPLRKMKAKPSKGLGRSMCGCARHCAKYSDDQQ